MRTRHYLAACPDKRRCPTPLFQVASKLVTTASRTDKFVYGRSGRRASLVRKILDKGQYSYEAGRTSAERQGSGSVALAPDATVYEAIDQMAQKKVGAERPGHAQRENPD